MIASKAIVSVCVVVGGVLTAAMPCWADYAPYLRIDLQYQLVDWGDGTGVDSREVPVLYASAGPVSNDTGLVSHHGASARAKGRADYGSLGFYAYATAEHNHSAAAWGGAMFSDKLTISHPTLNGQAGSLNVWVDVEGQIVGDIQHPGVSPGAGWSVGLFEAYHSYVDQWDYSTNSGRQDYHGYLYQLRNFIYGQPFELAIQFSSSANQHGTLADYYNTMAFNMADSQVLDAAGNVVTDYTLTSMSGHDYLVPEPATLLLLVIGVMALRRTGCH